MWKCEDADGGEGNWCCDKCRSEKVRVLEQKLQNALRQTDELEVRNRELEAKLQMAGSGEKKSTAKIPKVVHGRRRLYSAKRGFRTGRYEGGVLPWDKSGAAARSDGKEGD